MNTKDIKVKHKDICRLLAAKNIKDSLDLIGELVKTSQNGDLIDIHYTLEFTYKNILKYTVEGITDPERQKIYDHLQKDVHQLADRVVDTLLEKYAGDTYYILRRETQHQSVQSVCEKLFEIWNGIELELMLNPEASDKIELHEQVNMLFKVLWCKKSINSEEVKLIIRVFQHNAFPLHFKLTLLGAMNLALMNGFSKEYIDILLEISQHKDESLSGRALVILLLALNKYDHRLPLYPELHSKFVLMIEDNNYQSLVQSIFIQLIRTRETERISQKLNDEIIPEVVKMHPKLKDKLDLENLLSESATEGKNPDWEDMFKDSPNLISKMEELTQWQMEGADVFLSTFKHLKHFPFFNTISNWLMPFYPSHPAVKEALKIEDEVFSSSSILSKLASSRFLCNSDKYSLILSIPHMPGMQKEMMGQMFSVEMEQMMELEEDEKALQANQGKLVASNQFIQDLYRLLKVHPLKHQFDDIFNQKMDFHNRWFFSHLLEDAATLQEVGEYYFKKDYYEDALELFELVLNQKPDATDIIQKMAFCKQQLKHYNEALNLYLKADLLGNDSVWNKKKIALCYRQLHNAEKALQYYKEAEKLAPDNLHTQASIGHCLLELENFEEALKYYFKVEYLDPGNNKIGRPIAWCSFVLGKFDQAEKYYHKLIISEKNKHDFINLGHTLWCKKQRKEALSYYHKSLLLPKHSLNDFVDTFNEDIPYLKRHGVENADIPLMLDQVRYALED